jgi:hypothetical protein
MNAGPGFRRRGPTGLKAEVTTMDWKQHVELAEHHKALGQMEILLSDSEDKPWHLVDSCRIGSSYIGNVPVSMWFSGKHSCGLTFSWSLDLEAHERPGAGIRFDLDGIASAMAALPAAIAKQFDGLLIECADKIAVRAIEADQEADRLRMIASELRRAGVTRCS